MTTPTSNHTGKLLEAPDGHPLSDVGNARRLIEHHGHDLKFIPAWGKWLTWDGRRWHPDETGEVERRAKDTIQALREMAQDYRALAARFDAGTDDHKYNMGVAKKLGDHATTSEGRARITAMIELAKSEPGVSLSPDALDADPWLLNVQNGTINLRTGELQPHKRADHLTKLAPVEYDPDATSTAWGKFLDTVTDGDMELQAFLQRSVGYSLTGLVSEEVLFFVHGPAATGKTTFMEAVRGVLGEYAMTADFESFIKRSANGGARNDIARLAGSRFVSSVEVDDGAKLAEGLVKQVTGGDRITARFLYRESFEFTPTFKLWLVANDAPGVRHDDEGLWRRILRVPFERVIPGGERDPQVKASLSNPQESGPAILAWAVQGALAWQREGLRVPASIHEATARYRDEMDPVREFLEEWAELDPDEAVPVADLMRAYLSWAEANGDHYPLGRKKFNRLLEARGCQRITERMDGKVVKVWRGIRLVRPPWDMELRSLSRVAA